MASVLEHTLERTRVGIVFRSTAALIRYLFALNAVIAAIEINKRHIDPFSPEQKVGGSNPLGRTKSNQSTRA